jgi:hypothetical protein
MEGYLLPRAGREKEGYLLPKSNTWCGKLLKEHNKRSVLLVRIRMYSKNAVLSF